MQTSDDELHMLQGEAQEWIETNLDVTISDLFTELQDGVLLCRLVEKCGVNLKYKSNARQMGSFFWRDNICQFCKQCTEFFGVPEGLLIDPEDLVQNKNQLHTLTCLLYLAKLAVQHGLRPPTIVSYELEIDAIMEEPAPATTTVEEIPVIEVEESPPPPEPLSGPAVAAHVLPSHLRGGLTEVIDRQLQSHRDLDGVTFEMCGPGQYNFVDKDGHPSSATGSVHIRSVRGVPIVRVGGGWMPFLKFVLTKYGKSANPNLNQSYAAAVEGDFLQGPTRYRKSLFVAVPSSLELPQKKGPIRPNSVTPRKADNPVVRPRSKTAETGTGMGTGSAVSRPNPSPRKRSVSPRIAAAKPRARSVSPRPPKQAARAVSPRPQKAKARTGSPVPTKKTAKGLPSGPAPAKGSRSRNSSSSDIPQTRSDPLPPKKPM
eukprot:NODE_650_length_1456_cov_273.651741_g490_i0.p1 GENE.NODE_650_length_1456_cov_273.651741_g490_i0~~NODE_650_length_1456_cov_273.651741_g490_i0.p1  ORF type:complete len:430 (+),score=99.68 NODE_650_length_1456_cov_273.651741_g490_i0:112-1401(+)